MPAFEAEEWVRDGRRRGFTIQARVRHALWPGGQALCHRLTAPKYMPDMWFIQSSETGQVSDLRAYRYGMFRGQREA